MDNFNLNLFKYFYYVVLYNGVTNASKNLSVAQPSLSLSIKNLEGQLQKTLIDRTSKQFMLTDEGEKLSFKDRWQNFKGKLHKILHKEKKQPKDKPHIAEK